MKISFIIPVYKVEQYLKQCVDSILCQTYKDIEVILVDDGSPDSCPLICDEFASQDSRVTVIHKNNEGQSAARNDGLAKASGDYVCFVDSDDFIDGNDSLSKLMSILKDNPSIELLFFNVFYYYTENGSKSFWPKFQKEVPTICTSTEAIQMLVNSGTVPMAAWGKLIRRTLLVESCISFQVGLLGEDTPWFISMMEFTKEVAFSNDFIYAYRQNISTSVTRTKRSKHIKDTEYIIENECKHLERSNMDKKWIECMFSFIAYNYCILLSQWGFVSGNERRKYWKFMRCYKYLLNYTIHPKVKKVNQVYKIIGLRPTSWVLRYYLKHR